MACKLLLLLLFFLAFKDAWLMLFYFLNDFLCGIFFTIKVHFFWNPIECAFLTDLRNKTITYYTFSVRPTIPESKNVKIAMKKLMKKKMKTLAKTSISTLRNLFSAKKKHFEFFLRFLVCLFSLAELKIDFRNKFL